jgi:hypothetical protein
MTFSIEKLDEFIQKEIEHSRNSQPRYHKLNPIPKEEAIAFVEGALDCSDDTKVRMTLADGLTWVIMSVKELKFMKKMVLDGTYSKFRNEPYFIDWMWMYD